jgi:hypothetical protein
MRHLPSQQAMKIHNQIRFVSGNPGIVQNETADWVTCSGDEPLQKEFLASIFLNNCNTKAF